MVQKSSGNGKWSGEQEKKFKKTSTNQSDVTGFEIPDICNHCRDVKGINETFLLCNSGPELNGILILTKEK